MLAEIGTAKSSQTSTVDYVIEAIRNLLLDGSLKPGECLPAEGELTKLLSVSRGSLREAKKILSVLGVLKIKRGDGSYIAESDSKVALDTMLFSFALSQPSLKEIYDLRLMMETGIIEKAIDNATDEDVDELQSCLSEMMEVAKKGVADVSQMAELDIKFHELLGKLTRNNLIIKIYSYIMSFLSHSIIESHRTDYAKSAIDSHALIIDAIRTRDKTRIKEVTTITLNTWYRLVEKKYGKPIA